MKQSIKKELTNKQKLELQNLGYRGGFTIADLIEFLGDDLFIIRGKDENQKKFSDWTIRLTINNKLVAGCEVSDKELCNALLEACKYKLKNL